jgi:hypothetical protein
MIFLNKNWPFDLRIGYLKPFDLANACEAKLTLIEKLDAKFEDEVEQEEFPSFFNIPLVES